MQTEPSKSIWASKAKPALQLAAFTGLIVLVSLLLIFFCGLCCLVMAIDTCLGDFGKESKKVVCETMVELRSTWKEILGQRS